MSDISRPVAVTPENQERLGQQANTAAKNKGGGGGMSDGERITRLETHFEYIQRDLAELKSGQKDIVSSLYAISLSLANVPTKKDLSDWKIQWGAIGVAVIALIVGGIIGGLVWIKPDAAPVIIQSGASQGSTVPAANTPPTPATPDAPAPRR